MSHLIRSSVERVLGGFRRWYASETDDTLTEEFVQDVQPIIDMNKRFQNGDRPYAALDVLGEKIASIPMVIVEHWKNAYGLDAMNADHWPQIEKKLLNNSDWKYLKTVDRQL